MIASFRNRYGLAEGRLTEDEPTRAKERAESTFGTEDWTARGP
ncbi:hypothetical protein ACN9M0_29925 [Streptomyces sp. R-07]